MRAFRLVRDIDVSGISGTGIVAEGIQFTDGIVVLRWLRAGTARPDHVKPTTVIHDDIESVVGLHGHNGATRVRWLAHSEDCPGGPGRRGRCNCGFAT